MAERSTGPVKPPVIDLTARTGARAESERTAGDGSTSQRPTRPPLRVSLDDANWPLLGGVAISGAVLGTILTYILALALPLPSHAPPMPPDLSPIVTAQSSQIADLKTSLAALQKSTTSTQVSLDATITTLDGDMSGLNKSIADLKAATASAQPAVDLTPLETELKTLQSQVDAIAAGASGTDAGAIAKSLDDLQTGVNSLTTRLNGVDATMTALRTDLDAARKTLSDHINAALPNEAGPAMKLPLIMSGLENALETGTPFQEELAALAGVLPDLKLSDALKTAAAIGLVRPDALMAKFEALLPDILAAQSSNSGDWTQNALAWAKSLLALRPASEEPGDGPEAIVSRLEGAMGRRDYAAATGLLSQLPAPMQAAAAPVAADIAVHAAADQLLADLRSKALSAAETTP